MDEMELELGGHDFPKPKPQTATTSRFQPKLKGKPAVKFPLPKPEPTDRINSEGTPFAAAVNQCKGSAHFNDPIEPPDDDGRHRIGYNNDLNGDYGDNRNGDNNDVNGDDGGHIDDDIVVQEFDVFFSPSPLDIGTSLYVMQYPLRPCWRQYELNERCQEVRVNPKESKVEFDLSLDVDGENYDEDAATSRLQTQTLSSSGATSPVDFAIGIIIDNQMHLNFVDAVVQLRPSNRQLDVGGQKRKQSVPSTDVSTKLSDGKASSGNSSGNVDNAEPWIPLEYHSVDSSFSGSYQRRMIAEKNNDIKPALKLSDYVSFLCPGTSSNTKGAVHPSRMDLLLMPLEKRLRKWLSEGPQVNRFDSILHLAPNDSIEDILEVLQQYADLVQGVWVTKSSLLYKEEARVLIRDYVVFQFTKNRLIHYDKRDLPPVHAKVLLGPLAVHRTVLNDYKFKESTDFSFIKRYQNIVKEQEKVWESLDRRVNDFKRGKTVGAISILEKVIKTLNPTLLKKTADSRKVDYAQGNGTRKVMSSKLTTMSNGS